MKLTIFCERDKRSKLYRFVIRDEHGRKLGDFGDKETANERALALQEQAKRDLAGFGWLGL